MKRPPIRGFSLTELLMALAVIGILAAIALPVYQSYALRARSVQITLVLDKVRSALALTQAERSARIGSELYVTTAGFEVFSQLKNQRDSTQPISGINPSDIEHQNLGVALNLSSGQFDTSAPGQYRVDLMWVPNLPGMEKRHESSRQIALAAFDALKASAYKTSIGSTQASLYLTLADTPSKPPAGGGATVVTPINAGTPGGGAVVTLPPNANGNPGNPGNPGVQGPATGTGNTGTTQSVKPPYSNARPPDFYSYMDPIPTSKPKPTSSGGTQLVVPPQPQPKPPGYYDYMLPQGFYNYMLPPDFYDYMDPIPKPVTPTTRPPISSTTTSSSVYGTVRPPSYYNYMLPPDYFDYMDFTK